MSVETDDRARRARSFAALPPGDKQRVRDGRFLVDRVATVMHVATRGHRLSWPAPSCSGVETLAGECRTCGGRVVIHDRSLAGEENEVLFDQLLLGRCSMAGGQ